jgi:lipoprotein-releasing system permease protein
MRLSADLFLALRYLRPKRTFVSVITLLSILGPILGVALLVIVNAIMSGFDRDIRDRILSMQAHLQVFPSRLYGQEGMPVIEKPDTVIQAVATMGAKAAPLIEGPVLVQVRDRVTAKYLRGILPAKERVVSNLAQSVTGRFELKEGEALIGMELAKELNLKLGDRLLLHSPAKLTRNIEWLPDGGVKVKDAGEVYLPEQVTIAGIFNMGVYEYDSGIIFVHLDRAADLFGLPWGCATSVQVRAPDPFKLDALNRQLQETFPTFRTLTWQEANRQLFGALRVEKNLMFFLLVFIVIVAAFGIAGTLITVVVQKTREIGILKAVGMSGGMVARIFLLQGIFIGVIGTILGTGLGALVVYYRNAIAGLLGAIMGVEVFPKELYHLTQIPGQIIPADLALVMGASLLICVAGALIPALLASAQSPAAALRDEN